MKKESISPQTFAKGLTAGVIVVASLGTLSLSEYPVKGGNYVPGTYSASAQGMESAVKVTITVDNTSITNVSVDVSGETPDVGAAIGDEVSKQILDAQNDQIDGVAGATVSSTAVKTALAEALKKAEEGDTSEEVSTEEALSESATESTAQSTPAAAAETGTAGSYTPGTYTASAQGLESTVTATGTFDENGLTDLSVDVSGETPEVGAAIGDAMTKKFLEAQSANVDGESGATITSDALKSAVADLFSQAGAGSTDTAAAAESTEQTTEEGGQTTVIDETKAGVGVSVSDHYEQTESVTEGTEQTAAASETESTAAAAASGSYTPGTYSASAQGLESTVTATGTFDQSALTDLSVDVSGETPEVGAAIGDAMTKKFLEAQSADVDGESGATITSDALKSAVADLFSQASAGEGNAEAVTESAESTQATAETTGETAQTETQAAAGTTAETAAAETSGSETGAGIGVAELSADETAAEETEAAQEESDQTAQAVTEAITEDVTEGAASEDAVCSYTPGTYTASAQGMESTVTAYGTFSQTGLIALSVDVSGETDGVGNAIGDAMTKKFLEAQSADVDAESGATTTSDALKSAVADLFAQASATAGTETAAQEALTEAEAVTEGTLADTSTGTAALEDVTESTADAGAVTGTYTPGTYTGSAQGLESTVTVTGTFDATSLTDVTVDVSGETPEVGAAIGDTMQQELLDAQSSDVEVVSGATISSNAVISAAADVFAQAQTGTDSTETAVQTEASEEAATETSGDSSVPAGYGVAVLDGSGETLSVTLPAQDTSEASVSGEETETASEEPAAVTSGPVEIDETKDGVGVATKD